MSKLYTKYGDRGVTFTKKDPKTPKNEIVIHFLGEVDELNSCLGYLSALIDANLKKENLVSFLQDTMSVLFSVGAYIGYDIKLDAEKLLEFVGKLEDKIDKFETENGVLKNFILPTGGACSGYAHVCRSVCRRVERHLYDLRDFKKETEIQIFLNRLSDFLFSLARTCNRYEAKKEIIWKNTLEI